LNGDVLAADLSENESTRVSFDRRLYEMRDLWIWDPHRIFQLIGKRTQPAAKHDRSLDRVRIFRADEFRRLNGVFVRSLKLSHAISRISQLKNYIREFVKFVANLVFLPIRNSKCLSARAPGR
jgi:hypothetical protein